MFPSLLSVPVFSSENSRKKKDFFLLSKTWIAQVLEITKKAIFSDYNYFTKVQT